MALKSMALTKADRKAREEKYKVCGPYEGDKYPYGLRLNLEKEVMDKLDLDSLPKAGTKMILTAEVEVAGSRQSERADGTKERSLDLQITKMALASGKSELESAVDDAIADADEDA